jgi:hypothetical protein
MQRLLTLLVLLMGAGSAWAGPASVAILPIESPDEAAALHLNADLRKAVAAAGMMDHGPVAMTVEEAKLSFSCFDGKDACMAQVGAMLTVDRLLWGRLARDGERWFLELHLIETRTQRGLREIRIDTKGPTDFPFLTEVVDGFVQNRQVARAKVSLKIVSTPSDAEVRVDGVPAGRTPLSLKLAPGNRAITISKSGFASKDQLVRLGTADEALTVRLARESVAAPVAPAGEAKPRDRTLLWVGVGLAGLAVGAGAMTAVARAKSADLFDDEPHEAGPAYDQAESDYDKAVLTGDIALAVTGVAAAGAVTAVVLYLTGDEDRSASVWVGPSGLGVVGQF